MICKQSEMHTKKKRDGLSLKNIWKERKKNFYIYFQLIYKTQIKLPYFGFSAKC